MQDHVCETSKSPPKEPPSRLQKRLAIAACGVLTVFLCSGATSPTNCSGGTIGGGPSAGEVYGAAAGVGAGIAIVILVAVNASHHTVTGCVRSGLNGLELQTSDKRYSLEGDAASIKVGDRVKIHGSRVKKTKDQTGDQVFRIEKIKKDCGPCPAKLTP